MQVEEIKERVNVSKSKIMLVSRTGGCDTDVTMKKNRTNNAVDINAHMYKIPAE